MVKILDKIEYISMSEAGKITPYAQDYLSLLCRRDLLKSKKIGRKWYTTVEWLNEYLAEVKPEAVIKESQKSKVTRLQRLQFEQESQNLGMENPLNPSLGKWEIGGFTGNNFKEIEKRIRKMFLSKAIIAWSASLAVLIFAGVVVYIIIQNRIKRIETNSKNFIPEEVIKVPNEDGGWDIYGEGRMKIGEEEGEKDSMRLKP